MHVEETMEQTDGRTPDRLHDAYRLMRITYNYVYLIQPHCAELYFGNKKSEKSLVEKMTGNTALD